MKHFFTLARMKGSGKVAIALDDRAPGRAHRAFLRNVRTGGVRDVEEAMLCVVTRYAKRRPVEWDASPKARPERHQKPKPAATPANGTAITTRLRNLIAKKPVHEPAHA